ncbi:MAG: FkbM family methyltransferase [Planctomycetota bacterium]|nr:FkbM family methyltransferase [Planctomycetota bacterium]
MIGDRAYIWLHDRKNSRWQLWFWVLIGKQVFRKKEIACPTEFHGNWVVNPTGLTKDSVVYSVGVGKDISFDLSMIAKYGVTVHAFDPTPEAVAWVRGQTLPGEFRLHEYGLADFDGVARFQAPDDPTNTYYSITGGGGGRTIEAQVRRLDTLMKTLGHQKIDLLKMDIEGAEYGVIDQFAASDIQVGQLLVEFHHRACGASKTRKALRALGRRGYRIFHVAPSLAEYSFLLSPDQASR